MPVDAFTIYIADSVIQPAGRCMTDVLEKIVTGIFGLSCLCQWQPTPLYFKYFSSSFCNNPSASSMISASMSFKVSMSCLKVFSALKNRFTLC